MSRLLCALLALPTATVAEPDVVSTIRFEPFDGAGVVSWVQPAPPVDGPGDGPATWFVEREGVDGLVQQDRLADGLVLCTARLEDGAEGRAAVVRGASSGAAEPLAPRELPLLRLVLKGHAGARYVARLTADASPKTVYAGHLRRTTRTTTRFLRKHDGGLDPSDAVLGVHAYVTQRAGTDAVELDLRIHNGAQTPGLAGACRAVDFAELELHAGDWMVREGTARIATGRNVVPPRAQLVRRFVLAPPDATSSDPGFRTAYADGGASYFTQAAYGPDRTLVPRVDLDRVRHGGDDLAGTPLGPFRVIDAPNADAPGGTWIFPFPGGRRGLDPRGASLAELEEIADRVQERMPIAFFDAESGEPLTSRALAAANGGRQPFQYDLAARHGIRRYDLPDQPRLPRGVLTGPMGIAVREPRGGGEGACPYEAELERWLPYDGQHLIRGFTHAAALWFWTGDALSADWIRMVAADAGYDFTLEDVGGVERPYRLRSLKTRLAAVERAPGQGTDCDREWAWVAVVTSLAHQIEPTDELAARCTALLRLALTSAMPSGIPWRIRAPGSGGNVVYWNDYGTPPDVDACGTFQVPMLAFALSTLATVEPDAELCAAARAQIVRMAESVLNPERFTPSQYHAGEVGPPMSTWVARKDGEPLEIVGGSGRSNPTNFPLLYALASRASGDPAWFERAEELGRPGPKEPLSMALSNTGFAEAFAALALAATTDR